MKNVCSLMPLASWLVAVSVLCGCSGEETDPDAGQPPLPTASTNYDDGYDIDSYNEQANAEATAYNDDASGDQSAYNEPSAYDQQSSDESSNDPYASSQPDNRYGNPDEGIGPPQGYGQPGYQPPGQNNGYGYEDSASSNGDAAPGSDASGSGTYATKIQPILQAKCYSCHGGGPESSKADLVLSSPADIQSALVLRAGQPDQSELFIRVSMEPGSANVMPPRGEPLTPEEIETMRDWIERGASFTDSGNGYGAGYGDGAYTNTPYGEGNQPAEPAPPKTLEEWSTKYFQDGFDQAAIRHLHAATIAKSDAAAKLLEKYRWVPGPKRPALLVRWGIGIDYNKKGTWNGGPWAIGLDQDLPPVNPVANSGNNNEDQPAVNEPVNDFENEALTFYAGRFGNTLLERLQMRHERAYYGEILQGQLIKSLQADGDEFDDDLGGYSPQSSRGIGPRNYSGGYGYGGANTTSGSGDDDSYDPENKIEQIMPGVTMLGTGSREALLELAKERGIDALALFEVDTERNVRARVISSNFRLRLYDVVSQEMLAITGKINNVEMQRAYEKDPDDDTLNAELDKIFEVADKQYFVTEFPSAIKQEHVVTYLKKQLAKKPSNPLELLSEVRYFVQSGFLPEATERKIFAALVGSDGEKLASATDEDTVREILQSWLQPPASFNADGSTDSANVDDRNGDDPYADDRDEEDTPRLRTREFR